jgi:ATP-dependent DNA ligase
MANESIELYKPYTPKKLVFPAAAQQKLDGVPVKFKNIGGHIVPLSRQNEVYKSLGRFTEHVRPLLLTSGSSFTGELWIPGVAFKDISGMVRRHEQAPDNLRCYVFDFDILPVGGSAGYPWATRHKHFTQALAAYLGAAGMGAGDCPIQLMPSIICHNELDVMRAKDVVYQANPNAEGLVLHSISKLYAPGKRVWTTQKLKPEPTIDLRIVRVLEATSTEHKMGRPKGTPLGMVGRLEAEFTGADGNTSIIGVGPGSLTHAARRALWLERDYIRSVGRIAEIRYMRDDSYDALRQPTFVRWRDDKRTPNGSYGETI